MTGQEGHKQVSGFGAAHRPWPCPLDFTSSVNKCVKQPGPAAQEVGHLENWRWSVLYSGAQTLLKTSKQALGQANETYPGHLQTVHCDLHLRTQEKMNILRSTEFFKKSQFSSEPSKSVSEWNHFRNAPPNNHLKQIKVFFPNYSFSGRYSIRMFLRNFLFSF